MLVNSLQARVVWAHDPHDLCCTWVHNRWRVLDGERCGAWWVLPTPLPLSVVVFNNIWNDWCGVCGVHSFSIIYLLFRGVTCCMCCLLHTFTFKNCQSYCKMNGVLYSGYCPIHSITFNRIFLETEWKAPTSSFILQLKHYFENVNVWSRSHSPQPIPPNSWDVVNGSGEH